VTVTSTPTSASVILDGHPTGALTPITFDLTAGQEHAISVNLPGYSSDSVYRTVVLVPSETASDGVHLTASGVPSTPLIIEPTEGDSVTGDMMVVWSASTDPNSDPIYYNLRVAEDTMSLATADAFTPSGYVTGRRAASSNQDSTSRAGDRSAGCGVVVEWVEMGLLRGSCPIVMTGDVNLSAAVTSATSSTS